MLLRSIFMSGVLFIANAPAMANQVIFEDGPNQIVLDAVTRDYLIRYVGNDGSFKIIRWMPPTNIDVSVRSRFKLTEAGSIRYNFAIQNKKTSPQPVVDVKILVSEADKKGVAVPDSWALSVVENPKAGSTGYWIHWSQYRSGLLSGHSQDGYVVLKRDLPGVGYLWSRGASSMIAFSDEGPRGKMAEYLEGDFFFAHIDGVPRPAAVPRIPNPSPFDAATVLTSIQQHIKTDMLSMQLIDPAFAAQLDPWFTAAIDAAKRSNTEGVRYQIKELRRLLKQEHADVDQDDAGEEFEDDKKPKPAGRIDRLAARVLDFDLKYVDKRLEEKK